MSEQPVINTRSDLVTAIDYIYRLQAEIERLKSEMLFVPVFPQWIPVSERLPEDGLYWAYVYSCDEKWQQETIYKISHGGWQIEDYIKVSHWMPLPPPPEGEA